LISIKKTANELERMEELVQAIANSYRQAIHSTAQYAIEMDPVQTGEFRRHLEGLQRQVESAQGAEDWGALQVSFRGELREYRDNAAEQLRRLREEIKATSQAVQVFAESVAATDSDHQAQIRKAVGYLETIAECVDPAELQSGIRVAVKTISHSIEAMQRNHRVAIAQLRDEIRLLHKQIDIEHHSQLLDNATGVWSRQKLDSCIAELQSEDRPFCILLVCIRNLNRLEKRYAQVTIDDALKTLLRRFEMMLDANAIIGRWDEQSFAAILEMESAAAISISRTATPKLSGDYAVQENGLPQNVPLNAVAGVIDHLAGADTASFHRKLRQMSEALADS
jgi:GGDEF domain-containing protein